MIAGRNFGRTILITAVALPGTACLGGGGDEPEAFPASGHVTTATEIADSGARTAWEALRYAIPHLTMGEDRHGRPDVLQWRGRSSLYLDESPQVYIDHVRLKGFRRLDGMPAGSIASIRFLTGVQATTYYGTDSGSGVIEITTKRGAREIVDAGDGPEPPAERESPAAEDDPGTDDDPAADKSPPTDPATDQPTS